VIWHLPFIRAIAAASPEGQVTFLAPPSSGAKELLAAAPYDVIFSDSKMPVLDGEGRMIGDTTTLADSSIVAELQARARTEQQKEE